MRSTLIELQKLSSLGGIHITVLLSALMWYVLTDVLSCWSNEFISRIGILHYVTMIHAGWILSEKNILCIFKPTAAVHKDGRNTFLLDNHFFLGPEQKRSFSWILRRS